MRQYKELDRQENRKEQLKEDCERAKKEAECEQKNYEHAWAEYEMKYQKFLKEQAGILALTLEQDSLVRSVVLVILYMKKMTVGKKKDRKALT